AFVLLGSTLQINALAIPAGAAFLGALVVYLFFPNHRVRAIRIDDDDTITLEKIHRDVVNAFRNQQPRSLRPWIEQSGPSAGRKVAGYVLMIVGGVVLLLGGLFVVMSVAISGGALLTAGGLGAALAGAAMAVLGYNLVAE